MKSVQTYADLKNGVLKLHKKNQFVESIKMLKDGMYKVIIERLYSKRSTQQNRYYRGYICLEVQEGYFDMTGERITNDEAHEILKQRCNYKELINDDGEVLKVAQTTTQLSTVQFEEYLTECRKFIYEFFNRVCLLPNEQAEMDLK